MDGSVFRTTGGGPATIRIDVSQDTYLTNTTLPGMMVAAPTANYTSAPGGNQLTTSYYDKNNTQDVTTGPTVTPTSTLMFASTGASPNAHPGPGEPVSTPLVDVPSTSAFALTGRLEITLGGAGANPPTDLFTLSTAVTAVPEPASIAMMGMGLPVVIVGLGWLRRRRAAA